MDIIKVGGYILKMPPDRYALFESQCNWGEDFAEPVHDFGWSKNLPMVCFIINAKDEISYIASGKKGLRAGTELRRLNVINAKKLETPIPLKSLADEVAPRVKSSLSLRIENGGLLPLKTSESFVDAILKLYPETEALLAKYGRLYRLRLARLKETARLSLAKQKEAIATALSIAGVDRAPLQEWYLKDDNQPTSFLDGLPQIYLREDQMIFKDLMTVPGYNLMQTAQHVSTVFQNDEGTTLTLVLANRLSLEEQTGTDLIYYNENFKSFIMVQYKAMEIEGGSAIFRFPNEQLTEEISRMDTLIDALKQCTPDDHHSGFRFNDNPFFLKFCPRIVFNPTDKGLIKGMYIHHSHWKMLEADSSISGPRGGRKLTYQNVGRYLDNTSFMNLVSFAWIGTTCNQSSVLAEAIRKSLESGKAVVLAVQNSK